MFHSAMAAVLLMALAALPAHARFVMIVPSNDIVGSGTPKEISLLLQFTHPFEGGPQMQMDKPEKFGVVARDEVKDLLSGLAEKKLDGKSIWETTFTVDKPADYVFFAYPAPYWEPTEDKFIVQVAKVIVDVMGADEGWDKPIAAKAGLPVEIVPLSRPYGLYQGNTFTGRVFKGGKPMPGVNVEVEWWAKGAERPASDAHVRQVVKTDPNGVFVFSMPKAGWWGFSAIMEADKPIKKDGKDKKVELGAVLWLHAYPLK
jgi:cobalt/nickel transport protein